MKWNKLAVLTVALSLILICSLSCQNNEVNGDKPTPRKLVLHLDTETFELDVVNIHDKNGKAAKPDPIPVCSEDNTQTECCFDKEDPTDCFERLHPDMELEEDKKLGVVRYKGSCYIVVYAHGQRYFIPCP